MLLAGFQAGRTLKLSERALSVTKSCRSQHHDTTTPIGPCRVAKLDARRISSDYIGSTTAFQAAAKIARRKNIGIVGKGIFCDEELQELTPRHDHSNRTVQDG